MSAKTVISQTEELLLPVLEEGGFELVDIEYQREQRGWILRVYVDKEGGIVLDDCADISRELGVLLEVEDFIRTAYVLEVSSPGIDRPLKKMADFERFSGKLAKIKMLEGIDPDARHYKRKTFTGTLLGIEEGLVRLQQNDKKGGIVELPFSDICSARLEFEF